MTDQSHRGLRVLQVLLVVAITESFVHYLDNTVRFSDYAGEDPPAISTWLDAWMIPVAWVLFTVAGLVGYRRFREGRWPQAAAWLGVYSASGLVSLLHYVGISISDLSAFQNTFVLLDVALGTAILAFAVWTAVSLSGSAAPAPSARVPADAAVH